MKKFLKFLRKNWFEITMVGLVAAITVMAYKYFHLLATVERNGIEAIGGEMVAFLIPAMAWLYFRRTTKRGEQ